MADLLKNLMDKWEASLAHTERTGYWPDTVACDRVIDAYAAEVARLLKSPGQFSGDSTKALQMWTDLTASEAQYRKTLMGEVRKTAPIVDPSCWWVVLETHPDATADQVKAAFREKMKECHPDRVAGLAAPIQQLAKEMAQRLTAAVEQYNAR
jgi:hypothetical protein